MITITKHQIKRILRYSFFVSLILWILVSIFILYKYVRFSSNKISSKGGTFVEGIFDSTSYLPYLRNDQQSNFYQGLLFNSCLKYVISPNGSSYKEDLCSVSTKDNKTYDVYLTQGAIWSDGTPLNMDDILFTYQDIVQKNKWNIKGLSTYKDLKITREAGNQLKVTFPTASVDNKLFFTNYILPKHVLESFDFQSYREVFSVQPTYTNCANIVSQTTDQYSLIFNLVNCKDTNLNFYQIKNLISFANFKQNIQDKKGSIVDVYIGEETLPGYQQQKLMTNKLVTVFFNTTSNKLRVRTRRALGGLIKRNFYTTGYDQYVIKNMDGLFDVFMSTGTNVKDFLSTSYQEDSIMKKDLLDSGIKPLPSQIDIKGDNQKFVFYVENPAINQAFTITTDNVYDRMIMEYNGKSLSDRNYTPKNKKATFWIGSKANNFGTGLNKYTVRGWDKGAKKKLATVDLYNLSPQAQTTSGAIETITILYYNTPLYQGIVNNLQTIVDQAGVSDYFSFQSISSPEELEGRLLLGDYDVVINTIDMGLKKDITKLFATDSAKNNPSQYQNARLISLLQQYTSSNASKRVLNEINDIYSKDMPFVILGKAFVPLNIKPDDVKKIGSGINDLYDYNRRDSLYHSIKLVNNVHIDGKKVWNYTNFSTFIRNALGFATIPEDQSAEELLLKTLTPDLGSGGIDDTIQ